jgi:predicted TIM-barrel fold metal-dependent hydrolase
MGMPAFGNDFDGKPRPPSSKALAKAWRPHVETVIDLFGAERCMFESNYPVDALSCGYGNLWNAFKRLAAEASDGERDALFAGTAARVYRIAEGETE